MRQQAHLPHEVMGVFQRLKKTAFFQKGREADIGARAVRPCHRHGVVRMGNGLGIS